MNAPERDPEMARSAPWWRGACLYQIYPRSFADSNGDGIGDLRGAIAHLDHVASLGVDGIWLSPFFASPMKDFGYDVADYRAVDPMFGDLADFDRLIERAHGLGLKVVIDQVFSHSSDLHPWFAESRSGRDGPKADWYVWADAKPDGTAPTNWLSVFGGPSWTWDARRRQYYLHNFLSSQPDLNLHNPDVQAAHLANARFWLDRGVDGFRLDAINFSMHDPALRDNPPATGDRSHARAFEYQQHIHNQSHPDILPFLERIRALCDDHGAFTVAEVGGERALAEMRAFTARGRLDTAYGFDFLYAEALSPRLVLDALGAWTEGGGWPSWAFSNHDAVRAVSRWAPPEARAERARLDLLLLSCLRGNIFLYQGEELGLPQAELAFEHIRDPEALANWPLTRGRDGARTPMPWRADAPFAGFSSAEPWLPLGEGHAGLAADLQDADPASQLALTRALLEMRRNRASLRLGSFAPLAAPEPILAFERRLNEERTLCVFNLGHEDFTWRPPSARRWRLARSINGAGLWRLPPGSGLVAFA